jgi:hypothetical protein
MVEVTQIVAVGEEAGFAIVTALDNVDRHSSGQNSRVARHGIPRNKRSDPKRLVRLIIKNKSRTLSIDNGVRPLFHS